MDSIVVQGEKGQLGLQSWSAEQTIDTKCRRPSTQRVENCPSTPRGVESVESSPSTPSGVEGVEGQSKQSNPTRTQSANARSVSSADHRHHLESMGSIGIKDHSADTEETRIEEATGIQGSEAY